MSTVDIILLAVLCLGGYEGYRQGFLLGILGLFGFVVAIILGIYLMDPMTDWLKHNVTEFNLGYPIFGFLVIFLITLFLIRILGWILKQAMDLVLLGPLDSIAGVFLGVVKAAFFISLFFWQASLFKLDLPKQWTADSEYLGYIEPVAPAIVDFLEPFFPKMEESLEKLDKIVDEILNDSAD
ncbi:CvpA family protein [Algoriphagus pacificus]|uniref:CvpA family protein n=1 Tax=Algoriphagus pacificus TaxID=2811234 RepID=A0ABS3CH31_9BACT|nr:CvpA family protein [Algoriphagus pacificus]MBN7814944.1 CvpA family protein [Algoriphagus pacificus]